MVWAEHNRKASSGSAESGDSVKCPLCREDFGPFSRLLQVSLKKEEGKEEQIWVLGSVQAGRVGFLKVLARYVGTFSLKRETGFLGTGEVNTVDTGKTEPIGISLWLGMDTLEGGGRRVRNASGSDPRLRSEKGTVGAAQASSFCFVPGDVSGVDYFCSEIQGSGPPFRAVSLRVHRGFLCAGFVHLTADLPGLIADALCSQEHQNTTVREPRSERTNQHFGITCRKCLTNPIVGKCYK